MGRPLGDEANADAAKAFAGAALGGRSREGGRSVWGARSADGANANVWAGAAARRTRRTQMFGARFSVWGARSVDEANANVRKVYSLGRLGGENANVRCKV